MLNQLCHAVHYKTKNSPLRRCCPNMYSCPDVLPFSTLQDYPLKPTRQSRLERRQLEDKKCLLAIEAMCPQLQSSECSRPAKKKDFPQVFTHTKWYLVSSILNAHHALLIPPSIHPGADRKERKVEMDRTCSPFKNDDTREPKRTGTRVS